MTVKIQGQGEAVLLLHSSLSSHRQWAALAAELTALHGYCVISADFTGYGNEPCPVAPRPFSLADEVELLVSRLPKELLQQPIRLVGHSYGGAVALQIALSRRLNVVQLALFEPVAFHLLERQSALWQEVAALSAELPTLNALQAAARFIDYWQAPGYFATLPAKMQQALAAQVGKVSLDFEGLAQAPWTLVDYHQLINIPVWLGSGEQSRDSAKQIAHLLASALTDVQFVTFACGHMGPVTHSELINQALLQFLTD